MASSLGELSQAELSNIVGGLTLEADGSEAADPDDILKQLGETAFDNFDTFFTDLTNATASAVQPIEIKVIIINDLHLSSLRYSDIIDKKWTSNINRAGDVIFLLSLFDIQFLNFKTKTLFSYKKI